MLPRALAGCGEQWVTSQARRLASSFEQRLNAGDLEAVIALYEPDARFEARLGGTLIGRDRIDTKSHVQSRVLKAVTLGDIALLYTDIQGTAVDPAGKAVEARFKAIEILRRQDDGNGKLIVGELLCGRTRCAA
jgi:ketosteroid isomerase-like protein